MHKSLKFLLISFLIIVNSPAFAQKGKYFPAVETEKVSGETVVVPTNFKGSYVMIGVGTSKKAEDALRTWQNPLFQKFIARSGLMDDLYDVELCFLPLFTGAARMAKDKVVKQLKQNNESLVIDNVFIYSGSRDPFTEIGIDDRTEPYFFLLDETGKIIWYESGSFNQKYLDQIDDILNSRL